MLPIPGEPGEVGVNVILFPETTYVPPITLITGVVAAMVIVPTPLMSSSLAKGDIVTGKALFVSTVSGLASGALLAGMLVQAAGTI